MRNDQSTRSRREAARAAMRLMRRDRAREAPADAVEEPEHVVVDEHVLEPLAAAARALARRVGAGVGPGERQRRVREGPELEVVGASARSSSEASTSSSGAGASTPRSRKAGTQRSVTATTTPSAPSPIRAARSRSPPRQLALAAVAEHQLDRLDLGRQVRQPRAGAVRAGGQRAGHRLHVDVAEVRQRQPAQVQLAAEPVQRHAGLHPHERRRRRRARAPSGRARAACRGSARRP